MLPVLFDYLQNMGWLSWSVLQLRRPGTLMQAIFEPERGYPSVVAKFHDFPQSVLRGKREAAALELLSPVAAQAGIPRLLLCAETAGGLLVVQSGMPGNPWPDEPVSLEESSRQLVRAVAWLVHFQSLLPPRGCADLALRELMSIASDNLSTPTLEEHALMRAATEVSSLLSKIPAVAVHGDFWAGNILEDQGTLSVVDWSCFYFGGITDDLFAFLASLSSRYDADPLELAHCFWRVFFEPSPLWLRGRDLTFQLLNRYGLSGAGQVRALFLLFLISRLARIEFTTHPAWRAFVSLYVSAGMPAPFEHG